MLGGLIHRGFSAGKEGGGGSDTSIIDAIDKLPTLYTYTAGEFSFDFKIEDFTAFNLPFTATIGTSYYNDVLSVASYPIMDYVCKKGSQIICVHREALPLSNALQQMTWNIDGDLIYKSEISQMNISDIKVSIHSAAIYFLIYGSMKYAAENYNTGYMSSYDITLNGNQTFLRGGSYDEKTLWILNGSIMNSLKAFDEAVNEIVNAINN